MDSQDNLIFKKGDIVLKTVDLKDPFLVNPVFTFEESKDVDVYCESGRFKAYVECLVDTGHPYKEGDEICINEQKHQINDGSYPFPPFLYPIRVEDEKTGVKRVLFYSIVREGSADENQYRTMIDTISEWDQSLLYENYNRTLIGSSSYGRTYVVLPTLLAAINKKFTKIKQALVLLESSIVLDEKKELVKSRKYGKQSAKSIAKNSQFGHPDKTFVTRLNLTADTPTNRYIVGALRFCRNRLIEAEKESVSLKRDLLSFQDKVRLQYGENSAEWRPHVVKRMRMAKSKVECIDVFLSNASQLKKALSKLLDESPLSVVNAKSGWHRMCGSFALHNPHFRIVERDLFLPLCHDMKFNPGTTGSLVATTPIKKTSKVFEVYVLVSIVSAIEALGFNMIDEPEKDGDRIVLSFANGDRKCDVSYGIEVKNYSDAGAGDIFYLGRVQHVSPDFCVVLKEHDKVKYFLVIDAKCKRTSQLQKEITKNRVSYENTICDYLSFRYAAESRLFDNPKTVDSLWFVFPNDGNSTHYAPVHNLEYVFVKLVMDGNEVDFGNKLGDLFKQHLGVPAASLS